MVKINPTAKAGSIYGVKKSETTKAAQKFDCLYKNDNKMPKTINPEDFSSKANLKKRLGLNYTVTDFGDGNFEIDPRGGGDQVGNISYKKDKKGHTIVGYDKRIWENGNSFIVSAQYKDGKLVSLKKEHFA